MAPPYVFAASRPAVDTNDGNPDSTITLKRVGYLQGAFR
jgi:hypothetical protein